jgi:hypothetical protein
LRTRYRLVGLLALCGFVTGCAGTLDVPLRDDGMDHGQEIGGSAPQLLAGENVKITLQDGRVFLGRYLESPPDSILMSGENQARLSFGRDEVRTLEIVRRSPQWYPMLVMVPMTAVILYHIFTPKTIFSPDDVAAARR